MTRSLSGDLRGRVIAAIEDGVSTREAARRFRIGISTAGAWLSPPIARPARWRHASRARPVTLEARCARGFSFSASSRRRRMSPLPRSGERLAVERGVRAAPSTVWLFLDRRGITFKKKSAHASEQQRPDVLRRRIAWFDGQLDLDPERLIFIDETAASTKMARLRGRAPMRRAMPGGPVPHGHWKTTTFTAGLRLSGMAGADAARWPHEWCRLPGLCRTGSRARASPRRHRRDGQPAGPQDKRRARGHREGRGTAPVSCRHTRPTSIRSRWLSPSSRHCSEKAAARTIDELWSVVADRLSAFTPQECRHYFEAAGYDPD